MDYDKKGQKIRLVPITVLKNRINPKNNAPGVSKPPLVANFNFELIPKIFSKTDDV